MSRTEARSSEAAAVMRPLWSAGRLIDLNYEVGAPSRGWLLHEAVGINAAGEIAVRANPIDWPSSALRLTPR